MDTAIHREAQAAAVSPSNTLLRKVRAAFVIRGETLHAWCKENNVDWSYAHGALTGKNDFLKAKELRQRILLAAELPPHLRGPNIQAYADTNGLPPKND
jgi:hypothetical protein